MWRQVKPSDGHRALTALLVVLHLIGIFVGVGSVICLETLVPTGAEGGWLTRIYVGFLFTVTAIANFLFLLCIVFRKGMSNTIIVVRLIVVLSPIILVLWMLLRRG